ncbi:class 1b ribonucleoside-diphosphate reductase subunit alpha [Mycoplasma sp. T363T]|uniref:Ribonucleoside-diphosphate reductase n=1 Tax=Mycoplasma bradburyae TaxID=2963128 RepID=A0ABT5GBT1_9MOLU|nr:class 1b ribonucleoside-diphosphate reductase subunit alpha [Mycoplasma bradburyae]MDC4163656.1 class 1b ribonucleoside-diphosphate reductase subunit alpha [Mycoplasma bradburyae]MDC4182264.1 class 1b ribonucleoside-diphosphate reductase subunit alpha [Mycoplasma bradburyae]MDC4182757.1 class 1b ribonucleoside-diphosphate reductase subunit alpha [Mycoplasma bradburyae]UTS70484.1 class 1b ribonucleoside-diphosphate reductase subunit alpha [Mycoplasma bradburyae]
MSNNFKEADQYLAYNAMSKLDEGKNSTKNDAKAVEIYMDVHVKPRTKQFNSIKERMEYLINNNFYEREVVENVSESQLIELYELIKEFDHKFPSFMGAFKFYNAYCLKTNDGKEFLETYSDRCLMNALFLGGKNFESVKNILIEILSGRFQPATPTFLNAGKKQRGEYVSCYLLRVEDNMESIGRAITTSLQLSKRGGGVALCLTNLREFGAPIKNIEGQASGVIPVMKILEDSFSYANQLGQRPGVGAAYLHAHHPDVMVFLDSKRENADEKIRIKSLALGLVVPDITFELAKNNDQMALFSPYDVQKEYGIPLSDIKVTEEYHNMVNNPRIKKTYISARKFFQTVAELHFESGYPYLLFDDTVNNRNPNAGRIVMSNLCSEIVQSSSSTEYNIDLSIKKLGQDISCNLGSVNIDKMMRSGDRFEESIYYAIKSLDHVSRTANLDAAPSIKNGNANNHALGLGAMNLHGFLATHQIYYNSPEALEFTDFFFYTLAYYAFKASNRIATETKQTYANFSSSKYADGSYFKKYTECDPNTYVIKNSRIKEIFDGYKIKVPTQQDWRDLVEQIKKTGLANSHLLAVAPTGSISYLSSCTPSLQPVVAPVEVRKEGKIGRIYSLAYQLDETNYKYYKDGAYELGPNPYIDICAQAQKHVDQAISLTLFMNDTATTRDLNKAYIRAYKSKCSSIYYVRVRQNVLEDSENLDWAKDQAGVMECEVCKI